MQGKVENFVSVAPLLTIRVWMGKMNEMNWRIERMEGEMLGRQEILQVNLPEATLV